MKLRYCVRTFIYPVLKKCFELIPNMKKFSLNRTPNSTHILSIPNSRYRTNTPTMRSLRKRHILRDVSFRICHFLIGFCVGLLLYCELSYVGLLPPATAPDISIFQFFSGDESYTLKHKVFKTSGPSTVFNSEKINLEIGTATTRTFRKDPRILCLIHVTPLLGKAILRAIGFTWGRECDYLLLLSEGRKRRFPNEAHLRNKKAQWDFKPCWKDSSKECLNSAWNFVYSKLGDKFDWVVFPQDKRQTYVVIPNLKYVLSRYDSSLPLYFGNMEITDSNLNLIDAPVQIFSKAAIREFTRFQITNKCNNNETSNDDESNLSSILFRSPSDFAEMMKCVENANMGLIKPFDTKYRPLFSPNILEDTITSNHNINPPYTPDVKGNVKGFECCSDLMISFKVTRYQFMYRYYYLINQVYPYGISRRDPQLLL